MSRSRSTENPETLDISELTTKEVAKYLSMPRDNGFKWMRCLAPGHYGNHLIYTKAGFRYCKVGRRKVRTKRQGKEADTRGGLDYYPEGHFSPGHATYDDL
ncbi:MAG: hypothetical protein QF632_04290 [Candidatus Woesearchaeota archaeon]|jgi:hypothetical protein|nr:hypothetical protein [Candidatus Woesearchaeota archaeon]MDP7323951.1 hypothetical protein [Candidatus Woesearchaeota archaeon]MDP7458304.1 hypothetical protein [Candidatus Woesearchaeota archaeon]|tara:strand:+ start:217 stop:519 length:303 start_codon:yes stop_codon:yes gene_type:complete